MKHTTHYSWEEVHARCAPGVALISFRDAGHEMPRFAQTNWKAVLYIACDDISPNRMNMAHYVEQGYVPFTDAQAKLCADFIRAHWDHPIHAHCHAGVSRSAAVARVLTDLGWNYVTPWARSFGTSYANAHIMALLRRQLPSPTKEAP